MKITFEEVVQAAEQGDQYARLYLLALGGLSAATAEGQRPENADTRGTHIGVLASMGTLDAVGEVGWPTLFRGLRAKSERPE